MATYTRREPTLREQLIAAMGLRYDPFVSSVSESLPAADFGATYVDPTPSLLDRLILPSHAFVFADYGMGKTATRLALEFFLRDNDEPSPTLSISYTPRMLDVILASSQELYLHHAEALVRAMADDMVIQFIERYSERSDLRPLAVIDAPGTDPLASSSETQRTALRRQTGMISPALRRVLQGLAHGSISGTSIWHDIRPAVRYVEVTPQLQQLVALMVDVPRVPADLDLQAALADAQLLGFQDVFVLVDAIDAGSIKVEALERFLEPLIAIIVSLRQSPVFFKFFLPQTLKPYFNEFIRLQLRDLTAPIEVAKINNIPESFLIRIVNERFAAASNERFATIDSQRANTSSSNNVRIRNLDWFRGEGLSDSIQSILAGMARGSPRRMIELVSSLLDFHSTHGFRDGGRRWMTPSEWENFLVNVAHSPLA
jgi:hypothetical protein